MFAIFLCCIKYKKHISKFIIIFLFCIFILCGILIQYIFYTTKIDDIVLKANVILNIVYFLTTIIVLFLYKINYNKLEMPLLNENN